MNMNAQIVENKRQTSELKMKIAKLKDCLLDNSHEPEVREALNRQIDIYEEELSKLKASIYNEENELCEYLANFITSHNENFGTDLQIVPSSGAWLIIKDANDENVKFRLFAPNLKSLDRYVQQATAVYNDFNKNEDKWHRLIDEDLQFAIVKDRHRDIFSVMAYIQRIICQDYFVIRQPDKARIALRYDENDKMRAHVLLECVDARKEFIIEKNVLETVIEIIRTDVVKVRL